MPVAATDSAPAPAPDILDQCRSLTVDGMQCRNRALRGRDFCYAHLTWRASPTLPAPGKIAVPLLENHAAIQRMLTQILHALLARELPPDIAGKAIYCCQIALATLPRPAAPRAQASDPKQPVPEPVVDVATDDAGNLIGPRQPYRGPEGVWQPTWSMAKYMYEQECERLGRRQPTCDADMPASGWLTPEEEKEDPEAFKARYRARLDQLRQDAPPVPDPMDCPSGRPWCGGPTCTHHCNNCGAGLQQQTAITPATQPKVDLQAAADPLNLQSTNEPLNLQATKMPRHSERSTQCAVEEPRRFLVHFRGLRFSKPPAPSF